MADVKPRRPTQFYHDAQNHADAICKKCFWAKRAKKPIVEARKRFISEAVRSKLGQDVELTVYRTDERWDPDIWVECGVCDMKSLDYDEREG